NGFIDNPNSAALSRAQPRHQTKSARSEITGEVHPLEPLEVLAQLRRLDLVRQEARRPRRPLRHQVEAFQGDLDAGDAVTAVERVVRTGLDGGVELARADQLAERGFRSEFGSVLLVVTEILVGQVRAEDDAEHLIERAGLLVDYVIGPVFRIVE